MTAPLGYNNLINSWQQSVQCTRGPEVNVWLEVMISNPGKISGDNYILFFSWRFLSFSLEWLKCGLFSPSFLRNCHKIDISGCGGPGGAPEFLQRHTSLTVFAQKHMVRETNWGKFSGDKCIVNNSQNGLPCEERLRNETWFVFRDKFLGSNNSPPTYRDMTEKRELGRQGTLTEPSKRGSNEI